MADSAEAYDWLIRVPDNATEMNLSNDNQLNNGSVDAILGERHTAQEIATEAEKLGENISSQEPHQQSRTAAPSTPTVIAETRDVLGMLKLKQPVVIQVGNGTSVLPSGTQLNYSAVQNGYLKIHYAGTTYWVPKEKTDYTP